MSQQSQHEAKHEAQAAMSIYYDVIHRLTQLIEKDNYERESMIQQFSRLIKASKIATADEQEVLLEALYPSNICDRTDVRHKS
jgi:hypothetical protein